MILYAEAQGCADLDFLMFASDEEESGTALTLAPA
jgi:hypothetical protein